MPATSQAQQITAAIALKRRRAGQTGGPMASMSTSDLEHFASTPRKGLPYRKGTARKRVAGKMSARMGRK